MDKAARSTAPRATPATGRAAARRPARRSPWRWLIALTAVVAAVAAVVVSQSSRGADTSAVALTHVHGIGIDPADGTLYVATHDGVYTLTADGQARLVGEARQTPWASPSPGPTGSSPPATPPPSRAAHRTWA